ncbi:YkgJ family cysteine cluster protein [Arachidicoccus ginsenosidivorans]|jgi:Fe-S-cluster containining protein|uniref:YkgJ family cysteine cluster protein n=1 Tax=Arachidicoccus ginsenosidivorans TaxID=496057 RepID=A0A5B8VPM4_9BACT|nr:YkgJ family cysteine cluster protein [Arachidicoccus ginsenosidivorans]QEC72208.1 YkgJ family cysteine cluster protein [Arachidicoccus ginsenosidivorans]
MEKIDLKAFAIKAEEKKKGFRRFVTKIENQPPKNLNELAIETDKQVWQEIDCTTCANCCKTMTPTFTPKDIKRAATFLHMTPATFKAKWLIKEKKDTDWVNRLQPCQFLDLSTNLCTIYEARPDDCAGFPHLAKLKVKDYIHIHRQNMTYCPATYRFIELLKEKLQGYPAKKKLTGLKVVGKGTKRKTPVRLGQ